MLTDLRTALRPALALTLLFALLLGLAYPLALTGAGQLLFPAQANGSLVRDGERIVGSALIGQSFATPGYFHGRPSAAGKGYDALASAGSNLGPNAQALADRITPSAPGTPADLVTASASGLDPHVSPEAALSQVARVAAARGVAPERLRALVDVHVEAPALGFLGEPRVNVLALNRALDRLAPRR
jgi:K+-transporting ATPase ATPase C chain